MSYIVKLTDNEATQSKDFPVEAKVYSAGVQLVPTAATITVKDPDGTSLLAAATMAIAAGGTMTYTVLAATLADLMENAILEIAYTVSSVVHKAPFFFDCVLNPLRCGVTDDDLKAYFPDLASDLWSGTANFSGQIDEAFKVIKREIKNRGRRPAMIIDASQVRELVIVKTLEMLFFNFAKAATTDDIWWARYEKYRDLYKASFDSLVITYDEDESGTIEDDETASLAQVSMQR